MPNILFPEPLRAVPVSPPTPSAPSAEGWGFPTCRGRVCNGTAVLSLAVVGGGLVVSPEAIEVKSGPLPAAIMARLRRTNLARLAFRDPRAARSLRKLGSVEVRQ